LSLQAGVDHGGEPALPDAVVLELSVRYRQMIEIINVVQDDAFSLVRGHRKPDGISAALKRQARAPAGVAEVAEVV
jgi:hypothetical protein